MQCSGSATSRRMGHNPWMMDDFMAIQPSFIGLMGFQDLQNCWDIIDQSQLIDEYMIIYGLVLSEFVGTLTIHEAENPKNIKQPVHPRSRSLASLRGAS